ncbi:AAA family ATPase [Tuwongella immobilis]|uniref:AAA domain-containing protein n=1 Tax=Tuwongella immobilis TaxID=692036 RepID=A0A6C2YKL3_9BACT|nr:hypothetical protein [Tuwongella immobilis]VIP01452.1 Uncharacterized protein OS=Isosphaera pallida (strain ATCC 43644 / DSM 9630 / IS1B) GN=Isop_3714 PE=4 SV=1: AAA_31 [Tuwongella immobilis]VTR98448.1 Uncharacterized protein OS=Isosphaera pallida (strain ATCC 43644 / DSM 9630 / IS1B) GN=Isop_3714 PE=4 SV=1: AAA_31 [Tuwongella immobilis]
MDPLSVILVGLAEREAGLTTEEVLSLGGQVDHRFRTVQQACDVLRPAGKLPRRVFIVAVPLDRDLESIRILNDHFPGEPILLLTNHGDDAAFVRDAMRAGAAQVTHAELGEDFRQAMERLSRQFGLQPRRSRVVAVIGATEGCGTTTVAVNLAVESAELAKRSTILAELGTRLGRLAVLLNFKPQMTTQELLNGPMPPPSLVRGTLTPLRDHLHVLAGPYQVLGSSIPPENQQRLVHLLRNFADLVVVDTPYTYDEEYFAILHAADEIVLMMEQKISSVHAALLLKNALEIRKIPGTLHLVVNRFQPHGPGATLSEIQELLKTSAIRCIRNQGTTVLEAANNGLPIRDQSPSAPPLEDVRALLAELLQTPELLTVAAESAPSRIGRFLHWLTH